MDNTLEDVAARDRLARDCPDIAYTKYSVLGNTIMVVESAMTSESVRLLCDDHRGLCADQVMDVEPRLLEKNLRLRCIWNKDGSKAGACGNGMAALGHYGYTRYGLTSLSMEGWMPHVEYKNGLSHVSARHPWYGKVYPQAYAVEPLDLCFYGFPGFYGTMMHCGNHHIVVDDPEESLDITVLGPLLEHHPLVPSGANVECVTRQGSDLKMRVWERGSGCTQACGSGAMASFFAFWMVKSVKDQGYVYMPGGRAHLFVHQETLTYAVRPCCVASGTFYGVQEK